MDEGGRNLHKAVYAGHLPTVMELLNAGVAIMSLNRFKETPLHIAALRGHANIVKVLIEKGALIDATNDNGETPLLRAASTGKSDVVEILIDAGVDLLIKTKRGGTALHQAASDGHLHVVNKLLELRDRKGNESQTWYRLQQAHQILSVANSNGETPLHRAAMMGHPDIVKVFLEFGADPSAKNNYGNTPLHQAVSKGNKQVVQELLKLCRVGDGNIAEYLNTRNSIQETVIHRAVCGGYPEIVTLLKNAGADVNSLKEDGNTPLHLAVMAGKANVIKELINCQAELDIRNNVAVTPLHHATLAGKPNLMKILIDAGANLYNLNNTGNTGAHHAAFTGKFQIIRLLLESGFDVNFKNTKGNTLLHIAVREGHKDLVTLLLEYKANVDIFNKSDDSPFMLATHLGLTDIVIQLTESKAIECNQDVEQTLLHSAVISNKLHAIQDLMTETPDQIHLSTKWKGATAQDWANISGNSIIAGWLSKQPDGLQQTPTYCHSHFTSCKYHYEKSGSDIIERCQDHSRHQSPWLIKNIKAGEIEMHYMDKQGNTMLHAALETKNLDTVKELLKQGALSLAVNHRKQSPHNIAKSKNLEAILDLLTPSDQFRVQLLDSRIAAIVDKTLLSIIAQSTCLDVISERSIKPNGEIKVQKIKLEAVQIVNKLLTESFPYGPLGSTERHPLLLAITTNNRTLLPILLAAGLPLTTMDSGLGVVQLAWLTPDLTTWVGMIVTRAVMNQLQTEVETKMESIFLDPITDKFSRILDDCIKILLQDLNGTKPWEAQVKEQEGVSLTQLFVTACARGATLMAWYIWMAGASTFEQAEPYKCNALEIALARAHFSTGFHLVLDMKANPFIKNSRGNMPIEDFYQNSRLLEVMLGQDFRQLDRLHEGIEDEYEKTDFQQIILLFMVLYLHFCSERLLGRWEPFLTLVLKGHAQIKKENPTCGGNDWMTTLTNILLGKGVNGFKVSNIVVKNRGVKFMERNFNDSEQIDKINDTVGLKESDKKYYVDVDIDPFYSLLSTLGVSFYNPAEGMTKDVKTPPKQMKFLIIKALRISCEQHLPLFLFLLFSETQVNVETIMDSVCKTRPLHHAARYGNLSAVAYLLQYGESTIMKDGSGHLPIQYAYMYGHKSVGDYIFKYMQEKYTMDGVKDAILPLNANEACLKFYDLSTESDSYSRYLHVRTYEELLLSGFAHIEKIWKDTGIKEAVADILVNYDDGEAKEIKEAVNAFLVVLNEKITQKHQLYEGVLEFVGSCEDNTRLYCPDEFNLNLILKNVTAYPDGKLKATLKYLESEKAFQCGHSQCLEVECVDNKLGCLKMVSKFLSTFHNLTTKSLTEMDLENHQLKLLIPGTMRTKAGIALRFLWSGTKYPMLFVNVKVALTVRAPWPENLSKPMCMVHSEHLQEVHLNCEGKDEWRLSFGHIEKQIMKELSNDRRDVFLVCEMILATLKTEEWLPRRIKRMYWCSRMFPLPLKGGFALKNSFFHELEEVTDDNEWKNESFLIRMCSIFERMCVLDDPPLEEMSAINKTSIIGPRPVRAYFGGDLEKAVIYLCAPEVLKFLRSLKDSVMISSLTDHMET